MSNTEIALAIYDALLTLAVAFHYYKTKKSSESLSESVDKIKRATRLK